jgi:hypothetical protein
MALKTAALSSFPAAKMKAKRQTQSFSDEIE